MTTTIKLKNSVVKGKVPLPSNLVIGELAVGAHNESPALFFKDNTDNIIKIEPGSGVVPSPTPPGSPSEGDLWYNETTNSLNYWNGSEWIELGQAGDSPVTSVNGDVGVVVLDAADVGAATTAQGALADTAVQPGVVNPVYFASEAEFPDPVTYHGGVAHSHAANAMFYAHNGEWLSLANVANTVPLGSWADIPPLAPAAPGRSPILSRN